MSRNSGRYSNLNSASSVLSRAINGAKVKRRVTTMFLGVLWSICFATSATADEITSRVADREGVYVWVDDVDRFVDILHTALPKNGSSAKRESQQQRTDGKHPRTPEAETEEFLSELVDLLREPTMFDGPAIWMQCLDQESAAFQALIFKTAAEKEEISEVMSKLDEIAGRIQFLKTKQDIIQFGESAGDNDRAESNALHDFVNLPGAWKQTESNYVILSSHRQTIPILEADLDATDQQTRSLYASKIFQRARANLREQTVNKTVVQFYASEWGLKKLAEAVPRDFGRVTPQVHSLDLLWSSAGLNEMRGLAGRILATNEELSADIAIPFFGEAFLLTTQPKAGVLAGLENVADLQLDCPDVGKPIKSFTTVAVDGETLASEIETSISRYRAAHPLLKSSKGGGPGYAESYFERTVDLIRQTDRFAVVQNVGTGPIGFDLSERDTKLFARLGESTDVEHHITRLLGSRGVNAWAPYRTNWQSQSRDGITFWKMSDEDREKQVALRTEYFEKHKQSLRQLQLKLEKEGLPATKIAEEVRLYDVARKYSARQKDDESDSMYALIDGWFSATHILPDEQQSWLDHESVLQDRMEVQEVERHRDWVRETFEVPAKSAGISVWFRDHWRAEQSAPKNVLTRERLKRDRMSKRPITEYGTAKVSKLAESSTEYVALEFRQERNGFQIWSWIFIQTKEAK